MSNVVNDLMSDSLVIEAGAVSSDGGRPRTLVRVNPAYGYVIGVDVGETQIRVELFAVVLGARWPAPPPRGTRRTRTSTWWSPTWCAA